MIMRPGQQLLLPANPLFIWGSLMLALLLNMLPLGRVAWMPDFVAVALVFWSVHQPRRVGIGVAFAFGLCMDVQQVALLGQHAWAYTALSYFAITIHRRLLWFTVPTQALQVLPLFLAGDPQSLPLAQAVQAFLSDPKNVTLTMKARGAPVPLARLGSIRDPMTFLALVNVTLVANQ